MKIGPVRVIEKKEQDSQKSHKGVIFHLVREKSPANQCAPEFACWLPCPT